jgi:hypothetical protein
MSVREIQQLESAKKKLEVQLQKLIEYKKKAQRQCDTAQNELIKIEGKLEILRRDNTEVLITDHAVVRYLERINSVDIDKIKEQIKDKVDLNAVKTLGCGKFPIDNSYKIVVKDMIVVTIED